jgi:hypothetical protein
MRKIKYLVILMLMIVPFSAMHVSAHTPEEMQLVYNIDTQILNVTITHNIQNNPPSDPTVHYIGQVSIEKNGVPYSSTQYTSQPSLTTFTYNYSVAALDGDVLEVTAYCSIAGSILRTITVIGNNQPPGAPDIAGPTSGRVSQTYNYTFNATDLDGDNVKYIINWGDGNLDQTTFYPSATEVTVSHLWSKKGTYTIIARAMDTNGQDGPSSTLTVTLPRVRSISNPLIVRFLDKYPIFSLVIKNLLNL